MCQASAAAVAVVDMSDRPCSHTDGLLHAEMQYLFLVCDTRLAQRNDNDPNARLKYWRYSLQDTALV